MHRRIGIALFAGAALALTSLTGGDRGLTTQPAFAEEQRAPTFGRAAAGSVSQSHLAGN